MASVRQQGTYLDPLWRVHRLCRRLYNGGGMGKLVTLVGAALLVYAAGWVLSPEKCKLRSG